MDYRSSRMETGALLPNCIDWPISNLNVIVSWIRLAQNWCEAGLAAERYFPPVQFIRQALVNSIKTQASYGSV